MRPAVLVVHPEPCACAAFVAAIRVLGFHSMGVMSDEAACSLLRGVSVDVVVYFGREQPTALLRSEQLIEVGPSVPLDEALARLLHWLGRPDEAALPN